MGEHQRTARLEDMATTSTAVATVSPQVQEVKWAVLSYALSIPFDVLILCTCAQLPVVLNTYWFSSEIVMEFVSRFGLSVFRSQYNLKRCYSTHGLLNDISVLDLTRVVAGPFCTMTLGDLGANVIKVESLEGDEARKWGPPFIKGSTDSYYFLSINRNKKSICIDLKSQQGEPFNLFVCLKPSLKITSGLSQANWFHKHLITTFLSYWFSGKQVIYDLARKCDVLVENYLPGKLDTLEVGYEKLKKVNPKLVYCAITGFGPIGPYSKKPGYDLELYFYLFQISEINKILVIRSLSFK